MSGGKENRIGGKSRPIGAPRGSSNLRVTDQPTDRRTDTSYRGA